MIANQPDHMCFKILVPVILLQDDGGGARLRGLSVYCSAKLEPPEVRKGGAQVPKHLALYSLFL